MIPLFEIKILEKLNTIDTDDAKPKRKDSLGLK
jgi:hypothetical protein